MKIDFYWFNVDTPVGWSMGVALLSGELKARGHDVRLCQVDPRVALPWDPERLAQHSAERRPDVVAISFASSHVEHARRLVEAVSAALPDTRIVLGGIHPTLAADDVIGWPGVTAIGRGECDGVLADFIDAWAAGDEAPAVPGFWVRRADGSLRRNGMGPPPTLEGAAAFDDALPVERIVRANRGLVSLSVTRGCPYRCTYCHNEAVIACYAEDTGLRPAQIGWCRRRSVEDALAEVKRLVGLAGDAAKMLSFDDDTLLVDRSWFFALARRLADEVGLPYLAMGTVDRIDEDAARALGESGCLLMRFGLESASPRLSREILRRAQKPERVAPAFRLLRAHGVNTRAYVLLGIPTETRDDIEETLRVCGDAEADTVRPAFLQPYPRTDIHAYCVERGLLRGDPGALNYFDASPLRWPADHDLYLRKAMTLHPWLLSAALPTSPAAPVYRSLAEEVIAMDSGTWERPMVQRWARETTLRLDRCQRQAGIPHYLAPFPDRRDAAFLIRPDRTRPFPNVDDAWPPDAPWADEPVP